MDIGLRVVRGPDWKWVSTVNDVNTKSLRFTYNLLYLSDIISYLC